MTYHNNKTKSLLVNHWEKEILLDDKEKRDLKYDFS